MRFALAFLLIMPVFGQTKASSPGNLGVIVDQCNLTPQLYNCVAQVNGKPVCPYGRVTDKPLPGQPYTILTYPKFYADGVTSIYSTMCVYVLQTHPFVGDPLFNIPPFYF